jgi:predicted nuclease of predicted toxin-antitoxin system
MTRRVKFYTDEHVARAVARGLRQRGVDVVTVPESGLLDASDEEHLARAFAEGRVVFTQDEDFLRLHASSVEHAGIVYTSQEASIREIVYGLMLIFEVLEPEDMVNHVEYL